MVMEPRTPGRAAVVAATLFLCVGCNPSFSDATAVVSGPRVLAVQTTPAEAAPNATITLSALYVGPAGPIDASSIAWATCLLPKPIGDPGAVDPSCLSDASTGLVALGDGASVDGAVPVNACELFGPDSPPPAAGQPAARPSDPDATGGFYLPIRVLAPGAAPTIALPRLTCAPSGVSESVFTAFESGYVPNENPVVSSLSEIGQDGGAAVLPVATPMAPVGLTVPPGARVALSAAWPSCTDSPGACGGAETYLYIDPISQQIVNQRESMVVSWYATDGVFDADRVGRSANDEATTAANAWTAPDSGGMVDLWLVVRDSRGGTGWASYTVLVQ